MAITKKASARTKKDHKVTFKVTSVAGSEDQSVRVISNPSPTDTMRIDYFQLARKWKVDLLRYGLRMTYDIVIPNPGSGIVTLVEDVKALDAIINTPFTFTLPLSAIYLQLAGHRPARHQQLRPARRAVQRHGHRAARGAQMGQRPQGDGGGQRLRLTCTSTSVEFDIDENYYIYQVQLEFNYADEQTAKPRLFQDARRRIDRRRARQR